MNTGERAYLRLAEPAESAAGHDDGGMNHTPGRKDSRVVGCHPNETAAMSGTTGVLQQLRAVVLLGGTVRASALQKVTHRALVDLPVTPGMTVLQWWHRQFCAVAAAIGQQPLTVRLVTDRSAPTPRALGTDGPVNLRIEQDPSEFRGTGGLLSDLARQYDDDDRLLVVNAGQLLWDPMPGMVEALASVDAEVSILAQPDSTPSGLFLIRCGAMKGIPKVGFVDFKEQALPTIAKTKRVQVVRRDGCRGLPIRTLSGYLDALKVYYQSYAAPEVRANPTDQEWRATFGLIENGARVAPTAVIHDSVVLAGAVVEPSAVVVRSVVGAKGVVNREQSVIDSLVGPVHTGAGK